MLKTQTIFHCVITYGLNGRQNSVDLRIKFAECQMRYGCD